MTLNTKSYLWKKTSKFIRLSMAVLFTATLLQIMDPAPRSASAATAVLVGAGDIASCSYTTDTATAKLLDSISGTVFTTGDNVYPNGKYSEYTNCYHPTWGRHKSRTKPVPGNHDYNTSGAAGYFKYFSSTSSYYAYNLGDWRIYALNSNIDVSATSAQVRWLKNDLTANPKRCVLAYWHHPRWSSGSRYGSNTKYQALWKTLYDAGAEVVLNGHEHNYERFKQMNASGTGVSSGLRAFVVGTGGAGLYGFGSIRSTSEVRNSSTHGVLKLTLSSTSYSWKFVPIAGKTFTDSGTTSCH
ncbi:MAG TPA: metallophosphoesterase [Anaerolineales bacterium]|nr:metallophosphoesterase [Anaerolineales bacterium]